MGHEVFEYGRLPEPLAGYEFLDRYRTAVAETPPTIDGRAAPDEWSQGLGFDGLSFTGDLRERRARAHVAATRTHLYVAILTELPPEGELVAEQTRATDKLVWDDTVELWLDPTPGSDSGVAFQLLANSTGAAAYQTHTRGDVKPADYYGWRGEYEISNGFHDGFWHCEIAVPIEKVAPGRDVTQGQWGINICRDWKRPWGFSSLGQRGYNPADEIVFEFADRDALWIDVRHETDPFTRNINVVCELTNPTAGAVSVRPQLYLQRNNMPEIHLHENLTLAPGESVPMRLAVEEVVADRFELFVLVRGDEGRFQYTRFYRWGPPREARWDVQRGETPPIDFDFAYYPYLDRMRIRADASGLPAGAKPDALRFTVQPADGGEPVKTLEMRADELEDGVGEADFDLPPLSGRYEVVAEASGEELPEAARRVVKPFVRNVYEWEHNGLGTSRTVYPPFTPIEADGLTLRTAMKEYDLGATGLLDAVRTTDQQRIATKEILADPMRYRATVDGRNVSPTNASVELIDVADDVAVAASRFDIGGVAAEAASTLEYDGMLRVDLTLEAAPGKTIDSLDLEIPVRDDTAELMHAMVDGLRYPILTAPVPDGEGVIFSADRLVASNFPRNFCTYMFLGDPRRGVCWFAENDAGWGWDPDTPNLELIRDGDAVTIRVHLVNRPTPCDEPRTITFGVMAAPVKPMLPGRRHRWYTDNCSVIGTDIHWFALGNCASVYPAGKDLRLWEAIRESLTRPLSDEEIGEVIEIGRPYFRPHGKKVTEYFERMATQTLRNRVGTTPILYYNRSAYPAMDEFQTFLNEWSEDDYSDLRAASHRGEVKIVPTESYCDFAMHWYGKSFDHAGNTGIYVDNIFFDAAENTVTTAAYRREDGEIMPSTGIWALRELGKRQFVFMNERGMEPMTMVHMTSTQILPLNSFYTVQYDWELRFSEGDVHTRFPRDYILAVTNGEHVGAWPIVLHEQGRCVEDPWVLKTYLAVAIIHELIVDPYVWDHYPVPPGDTPENRQFETFRRPILELVRVEDAETYRYWDDRPQPVRAESDETPTIVHVRPGVEAIWAITSYAGEERDVTVHVDAAAMGFTDGWRMTDVETGEDVPVEGDVFRLTVGRHDLREFRILPT